MKILNYFTSKPQEPNAKSETFEFFLQPPDRTAKDLSKWKTAVQQAEQIWNKSRYSLYDIYREQIDIDAHLQGLLRKRTDKVLGMEIIFDRNGKIDEKMNDFLNSDRFRQFIRDLHETIYWGFSVFEFNAKTLGGRQWFDYYLIPRKHVLPHKKQIVKNQFDGEGMSYLPLIEQPRGTVAECGTADDLGLLKTACVYSIIKRNAMGDWGSYSERAGRNFEMVKFKRGDEHNRNDVMSALKNNKGGVIGLPEGVEVEMQSGSTGSVAATFENLVKWCNQEQSKLILGNVMTTDSGSSRSQAEVHSNEQGSIELSDREMILNYLNYVFWDYLPLWGINPEGGLFMLKESLKVEQELEQDLKLKQLGYTFTPEQIKEKYGIEE